MKKLILAAAAVTLMSGSAFADDSVCGSLPNSKWSWQVTTTTATIGGETSLSSADSTKVAGQNTFLVTTTTTTVAPTFEVTTTICTALNPQGKVNLDHSTSVVSEPELIDAGGTTTSSSQVKVCGPNLTPC
ncbi:MAG: hypothetical protein ACK4P4_01475 [Allorhizobium sp.]